MTIADTSPAARAAGLRLGRALAAASEFFTPPAYQTLQREALSAARNAGQFPHEKLTLQGVVIVASYIERATRSAERADGVFSGKRPVPFC